MARLELERGTDVLLLERDTDALLLEAEEKNSSDTGSGVEAKATGNPIATLAGSETGSGAEGLLDRALMLISESGSGLDTILALLGKKSGDTGICSLENSYLHILESVKSSADSGAGVDVSALLVELKGAWGRYEYYNTGDDSEDTVYGGNWRGQSFTPDTIHKINAVKLPLGRLGSPGTVTVSVRATDGDGHPTGDDLCSGTTNGNTLPTSEPYGMREIDLGAGYNLLPNTKYCLDVRVLSGDSENYILWRRDVSSPAYVGGAAEYYSGEVWVTYPNHDFLFEEWGYSIESGVVADSVVARALFTREPQMGAIDLAKVLTAAITGTGETGSGAEASLMAFYQKVTESGEGAEASTLVGLFTGEDSGAGAEAITLLAAMVAQDTGVSVEAVLSFFRKLIDSGEGAEKLHLIGYMGRAMKLVTYLRDYSDLVVYTKPHSDLRVYTSEVKQ